jgi:putative Mn2+ efflux pump MntP
MLSNSISALLIFSNVLPGFVYAIILCDFENNKLDLKRFLFIAFSGGLYIFVAWVATGKYFFSDNIQLCFTFASVIGATILFTLYYLLIDKNISFFKGFLITSCIGLLSSILPFVGEHLENQINDFVLKDNVYIGFTLLIFPVWQTLFGWTIYTLKKATANSGFAQAGQTSKLQH